MSGIVNEIYGLTGRSLRWSMAVCVLLGLIIGFTPLTGIDAYGGTGLCGEDKYCGIKGEKFDSIYYSNGLTGLVVLYDKDKVGDVRPWVSEKQYRKGKGTVVDAIEYLKSDQGYAGFKLVKGKKSTGFFRSEVVDGLYVVVPKHWMTSITRAPEFRFSEKNGKITLYIKDFEIREKDLDER